MTEEKNPASPEARVAVFMTSALEALQSLKEVKCKMDPKGCDGPWCAARKKILAVFASRPK